ncbi:hypothetical protein AVT69_gp369 [Pseudomonas phage PhiPA3]|uniref:Uncharacterized protein 367 n=1 Tax=Pseudomonas phage PhiPA3 TaxID=998086 RepID=F8SJJ9_BPPA3|nr:hypothetical protein AVT69_gp369 [Pseudomonas phage PhiPA3]AEH03790.1 hypothetical protein [Pseudomonas phage PhiPA3]
MANGYNRFVRTIVNYQDILDALIQKTNEGWEYHRGNISSHVLIRECRTVGFFVGRQCGSSSALVEFATRHQGECLAVFTDDKIQRGIQSKSPGLTLPYLITERLRKYIRHPEQYSIQKDFNSDISKRLKYLLVDNASYNLNLRGITDKEFNQWVADTFGNDILVIRFS